MLPPHSATRTLLWTLVLSAFAVQGGCRSRDFQPEGSTTKSLRQFDLIEIRPLSGELVSPEGMPQELVARFPGFKSGFPTDLRERLDKKKLLTAPKGRLLVLEGTVSKYGVVGVAPSTRFDNNSLSATIEVDIVLKDETGTRVGGGKASATGGQRTKDLALAEAEKGLVAAVVDFIKKSIRGGSESAPATK
jgi:hypothetical protein